MAARQNPPRDGEGDRAASRRGGGGSRSLRRPEVYRARKLRREMSLPEVVLWNAVRRKQLGFSVRKQHPIGPYIADFYCAAERLAIEIDGEDHNRGSRPTKDDKRDIYMQDKGYSVMRIAASDVLNDLEQVLVSIEARVASPLHRADGTVPLPMNGEDK